MARSALLLIPLSTLALADEVPGEVKLDSGAEIAAVCGAVSSGQADESTVYELSLPATAFKLGYDAPRARSVVDAAAGFRDPKAGYELVLHDLIGAAAPAKGDLEIAVPGSADDAKGLEQAWRGGKLGLTIWFQVAPAPACATRHDRDSDGVRLAIEPLAWRLHEGTDEVASGETPAFGRLRDAAGSSAEPMVTVATPVYTHQKGAASDAVAKSLEGVQPDLVACYQRGLAADASLRGALVAEVTLASDGKVKDVRPEIESLGAPELTKCALDALARARFPKNETEPFSVPMRFGSK